MLTIAIANLKGGVGKSTLAINLATLWGATKRVVLVDTDDQKTSITWRAVRAEAGVGGGLAVTAMQPEALVLDLPKLGAAFDVAVIDTPPSIGAAARAALIAADVAIIPTSSGPTDSWATFEMATLLEAVAPMRKKLGKAPLKTGIVMNNVDKRHRSVTEAERALRTMGLHMFDATIARRTVFNAATAAGKGIVEFEPRGDSAASMRRLSREVLSLAEVAA